MKRYDLKAFLTDGKLRPVASKRRWHYPMSFFPSGMGTLPVLPILVITVVDPASVQHLQSTFPIA